MGSFCDSTPDSAHSDLDFLFGSGRFNYVIATGGIKNGGRYRIDIEHQQFEPICAETTVPAAFEITQVSDVNLWNYRTAADELFSIQWTESENAAGYLVDISMLKYDLTPWRHYEQNEGVLTHPWADSTGAYEVFDPPDSVDFSHLPFTEIPADFDTLTEGVQRGILTQQREFSIRVGDLLQLLHYPIIPLLDEGASREKFDFISRFLFQLRIVVYAVDKNLYDYTAFQYLNLGKNRIVGQQTAMPDPSNINNGVGVFGAADSRIAYRRIINRGRNADMAYPVPDTRIVNKHGSSNDWEQKKPPYFSEPQNNALYDESEMIRLAWSRVDSADFYLLVLKPQYLWFKPANIAFLCQSTDIDIPASLLALRGCRVEAYVKALRGNDFDRSDEYAFPVYHPGQGAIGWAGEFLYNENITINNVVQLSPEKADLLLNGFYTYIQSNIHFFFYDPETDKRKDVIISPVHSYSLPRAATPWSESLFLNVQNGELPGFEMLQPQKTGSGIQWAPVNGADAYLVYVLNESGAWAAAVTRETNIAPPFKTPIESIEGARTLPVASGEKLTWRVQALRVKTGGLGFAIEKEPDELPKVYPRYKHPSGIMLCSLWSEAASYVLP